jgi:hypothetical protein
MQARLLREISVPIFDEAGLEDRATIHLSGTCWRDELIAKRHLFG